MNIKILLFLGLSFLFSCSTNERDFELLEKGINAQKFLEYNFQALSSSGNKLWAGTTEYQYEDKKIKRISSYYPNTDLELTYSGNHLVKRTYLDTSSNIISLDTLIWNTIGQIIERQS